MRSGNQEEASPPDRRVSVLAVSAQERDHSQLKHILSHSNWQLFHAMRCSEARRLLNENRIGVLVCDWMLPDGDWKDLLTSIDGQPSPLFVVAFSTPDARLLSEALNRGAYDVLWKPFEMTEVIPVVGWAWLHWKEQLAAKPDSPAGAFVEKKQFGLRRVS